MENTINFKDSAYYENRELSWIKFDHRVLEEARDKSLPLLERLKFVSITSSNLDEFIMVRVASLKDQVHANYRKKDIAGMTAAEQLAAINKDVRDLVDLEYNTFNRSLLPQMNKEGIHLLSHHEDLTEEQGEFVDRYFEENVYPVLTPMAVDASRPFPLIRNKSLNIGAILVNKKAKKDGNPEKPLAAETVKADSVSTEEKPKDDKVKAEKTKEEKSKEEKSKEEKSKEEKSKEEKSAKTRKRDKGNVFATVQVPGVIPRLVQIPSEEGTVSFILLEQIIERNIQKLFSNYEVLCAYPYRIMRNASFTIDEDEASDLLIEIQNKLKQRQWGEVIRLEIEDGVDKKLLKFLRSELKVAEEDVFRIAGPIDLTVLMKLFGISGYDRLRYTQPKPQPVPEINQEISIFDNIKKGDIFLHHPYETFEPVVDFIRQAAKDPEVLAIKQTLYRVSGNSPIIASLAEAAENGKQVTVLVELKARFDEEHNIVWAKKLEQAGCHVIYGLVGLKTHSKIALVVRREEDGIRRYVHLGTGNYNDSTAKLYTDCGIFTCKEAIGEDATAVFNMLSGYSEPRSWNALICAPYWLRNKFLYLIRREAKHARNGENAKIVAKMNSLCDPEIIAALYEASSAGVEIDLIVRGICCLKVGIPGVSENIHVRSIVGNFLEHSRIFYFENGGNAEIYMGSADWMPRNLDRRVEIVFPVLEESLKEKAFHVLDLELQDTVKARIMQPDGSFGRVDRRGKALINSQWEFCEEAKKALPTVDIKSNERVFVPKEAAE